MNIFVLDTNPQTAARFHCDKHIVKMVVETAQMLCTAHYVTSSPHTPPYKPVHRNHPCTIWTRQSKENYMWLCELGLQLSDEYTYRYGKQHASGKVIEWCYENIPPIPETGLTDFVMAMPDCYKSDNAVVAYRKYYIGEKHFAKWTKRNIPDWYFT